MLHHADRTMICAEAKAAVRLHALPPHGDLAAMSALEQSPGSVKASHDRHMAVPKRKKSPSKRNMRRRHRKLKLPAVSSDSYGNMHLRHYATAARRNAGQMSHENKPMSVVEGDING